MRDLAGSTHSEHERKTVTAIADKLELKLWREGSLIHKNARDACDRLLKTNEKLVKQYNNLVLAYRRAVLMHAADRDRGPLARLLDL